jgi:hypothetical protein
MSTWICKASAAVLTILALAACGGGGGSGGTGNITPDGSGGPSKIFLADQANAVVLSSVNVNPAPGVLKVNRTISGSGLSNSMPDMAYDPSRDELYVVNGASIAVISNASTANGNVPSRTITSSAIAGTITSIYLDTAHHQLYVVDTASNIFLFNIASGASGSITPANTFTINRAASTVLVTDIFVDTTRNILYAELRVSAAPGVGKSIAIFAGASGLSGPTTVTTEMTFTSSGDALGTIGDGNADRLFVANSTLSTVMVFDSASAISGSGPVAPNRSIDTPTFLQKIALVPGTNRLYGIAADQQTVYVVNNASTANSVAAAVPVTVLTGPSGSFLNALEVAQ